MKCYLDLDGTIADFVPHLCRALGRIDPYTDQQWHGVYDLPKALGITREECFAPCKSYGFWKSIPRTRDALGIIAAVHEVFAMEDIIILTRPTTDIEATSGKMAWIQDLLGVNQKFIITNQDKGEFAKYTEPGSLLIDDCDEYVEAWRKSGNPALLVPRLWNKDHKRDSTPMDWNTAIREELNHYERKAAKSSEVRVTDPTTGGQKGSKLAEFAMIPPKPLWELAEHFGKGAQKYSPNNWCKGYKWSYSYSALQRHLNLFWSGEDMDEETGSKHMIAAAWHCLTLAWFMDNRKSLDNRPTLANMEKEWKDAR
jgi:hypothetical protein